MLTLARFVLEKIGGDTMGDVATNLAAYRARIARTPDAPQVAGGAAMDTASTDRVEAAPRPDRLRRGRLRRRRLSADDGPRPRRPAGERQERRRQAAGAIATARRSSTSTSGSSAATGRSIPDDLRRGRRGGLPDARAARRSTTSARPTRHPDVRRVIATGRRRGRRPAQPLGAVPRPGERVWLDGRPEVLAQRLRRSPARPAARHGPRPDRRDPRPRPPGGSGSTRRPTCTSRAWRRSRSWSRRSRRTSRPARAEDPAARRCCGRRRRSAGIVIGDGIAAAAIGDDAVAARGASRDPRLGAGGLGGGRCAASPTTLRSGRLDRSTG